MKKWVCSWEGGGRETQNGDKWQSSNLESGRITQMHAQAQAHAHFHFLSPHPRLEQSPGHLPFAHTPQRYPNKINPPLGARLSSFFNQFPSTTLWPGCFSLNGCCTCTHHGSPLLSLSRRGPTSENRRLTFRTSGASTHLEPARSPLTRSRETVPAATATPTLPNPLSS